MSYDLYFRARRLPAPSVADLRRHFGARPRYQEGESGYFYEDTATGVYFSFDLRGATGDAPADPAAVPLAFNINFFRPHVFALEAEPEVRALCDAFGLDVVDPQADGMGEGPYSREGFLRGWNAGNAFAHRVCLTHESGPGTIFHLPAAQNRGIWLWNSGRERYLDLLGSLEMLPCFVPTVFMFTREAGPPRAFSAVVWSEAMPLAVPRVDYVLAMRERGDPVRLIPWEEIAPHLARWTHRPADFTFVLDRQESALGLEHWLVEEPQEELALLLDQGGVAERLVRLVADQVLDRELVDAARG